LLARRSRCRLRSPAPHRPVTQQTARPEEPAPLPLFEDPETRAFYESLPDLRAMVPAVLLGAAEPPAPAPGAPDAAADASAAAAAGGGSAATGGGGGGGSRVAALEPLLARLPLCFTRTACDEVAVEFCFANAASKAGRKRLVRALTELPPRSGLQLLPFYARVAAALATVFPDVAQGVLASLEEECAALAAKRDVTGATTEARLRNAHYLAELVKFNLAPPGTVFCLLKSLLDDFAGGNVDAACALVESAGRVLALRPETRSRCVSGMFCAPLAGRCRAPRP